MSRTDNTRPYVLQAEDRTNPGRVYHEHGHTKRYRFQRVSVCWGQLKEIIEEKWMHPYFGLNDVVIYSAYTGKYANQQTREILEGSKRLEKARMIIERCMTVTLPYDASEEFTDRTIVGYQDIYRVTWVEDDCDYSQQTAKLRLAEARTGRMNLNDVTRCGRDVHFHGGMGRPNARKVRQQLNRQSRQRARQALRSLRRLGDEDDFDITPGRFDRRSVTYK